MFESYALPPRPAISSSATNASTSSRAVASARLACEQFGAARARANMDATTTSANTACVITRARRRLGLISTPTAPRTRPAARSSVGAFARPPRSRARLIGSTPRARDADDLSRPSDRSATRSHASPGGLERRCDGGNGRAHRTSRSSQLASPNVRRARDGDRRARRVEAARKRLALVVSRASRHERRRARAGASNLGTTASETVRPTTRAAPSPTTAATATTA